MSRAPLTWSPRALAHRAAQVAVDVGLVDGGLLAVVLLPLRRRRAGALRAALRGDDRHRHRREARRLRGDALLHQVVALHEPARPAGDPPGDRRLEPDPRRAAVDLAPRRPGAGPARRPRLRLPLHPGADRRRALRRAQRDRAPAALGAGEQRQGGADLRRRRRRQHPAARDEAQPRPRVHARRPDRRRPAQAAPAGAGHPRPRHPGRPAAGAARGARRRGHHRHALGARAGARGDRPGLPGRRRAVHDPAGAAGADHRRGHRQPAARGARRGRARPRGHRGRLRPRRPLPQRPLGAGDRRGRLDRRASSAARCRPRARAAW